MGSYGIVATMTSYSYLNSSLLEGFLEKREFFAKKMKYGKLNQVLASGNKNIKYLNLANYSALD